MRKFIIYTILFATPFIIILTGIETMLRKIPNSYMAKADFMEQNAHKTQVLILGSSHGVSGIDPDAFSKSAYNMANYAQTLDMDYAILNRYKDRLDSLEYIIVPLSYHLLWSKLKYHPQTWRLKYYDIYYNISTEKNPLNRLLFLDQTMATDLKIITDYYLKKKEDPIADLTPSGLYYLPATKSLEALTKNAEKIAGAHKANDLSFSYDENVGYLKQIIEIAKSKNAKVIFVTIPAHPAFIKHLDNDQLSMLYKTAEKLEDGKDVFYYNFLHDFGSDNPNNNFDLFYDADHLSGKGAGIVAHRLDSIIQTIENRVFM